MPSYFSHIKEVPQDPIFGLNIAFGADKREEKINLSAGVYRTEELKTPILKSVKLAECAVLEEEYTKNYLPIEGDLIYLEEVARLVLGDAGYQGSLSSIQTVGGSGALRLGGEFAKKFLGNSVYIPTPSWVNHQAIFSECGLEVFSYPYYNPDSKDLSFELMREYLLSIPSKSLVLLHVSCHNPSGVDLTKAQWEVLSELCTEKEIIPFFDAAYLGFLGTIAEDAYPIRLFITKKIPFFLAVSFSKNFSLYGERVGAFFLFSNERETPIVTSQLKRLVRRNYSNPPMHGAKVLAKILQTGSLKETWKEELLQMKVRIATMRKLFVEELALAGTRSDYSYLLNKKGLFSYCQLSEKQVERLIHDHAIYLPSDGRINIAGLNKKSIPYVVNAIVAVGG